MASCSRKASVVSPLCRSVLKQIVVGRIRHDRHKAIILGRAAEHRWTANIDLFDRFLELHFRFINGRLERIKVDDHQIDWFDLIGLDLLLMIRVIPNVTAILRAPSDEASLPGHQGFPGSR